MKPSRSIAGVLPLCLSLSFFGGVASAQSSGKAGLDGVWVPQAYTPMLLTADGKTPPLRPAARKAYARNALAIKKGQRVGETHPCLYRGQPQMNFLPYPVEIVTGSGQIAMVYEWGGFRSIDMTGNAPQPDYPLLMGRGTGTWQGDTLIVRTSDIAENALLDAAGMPHGERLTVTETITLSADGSELTNRVRFDDPETFARPWETVVRWKRSAMPRRENLCLDRVVAGKPVIETRR